ncbi:MAG TPA: TolC family protein [Polyangia bacterium]|nr:TolC family protein [Polyangia bacterium]
MPPLAAFLFLQAQALPVSFADARARAAERAGEVIVSRTRFEVARAEVEVAGALANPTLTVLAARQTAQIGIGLSVPLPLFGQRGTAIRAARADLEAARLEVEVARNEARWNGASAWIDLWEAQERARVLALAAQDTERLLAIAQQRFDAGSAPRLDVVRATADRARAAAEAGSARAAIAAAGARLAPWLGEDRDLAWEASGRIGYPPAPPPLGQLLTDATDHPLLLRDRAESAAAEAHLRAEERQRWPVINGQVTVNQGDPTLPGTDVIGGGSLDLPVLNLRGGAIARARAQRALAEASAVADARKLFADLRDAFRRSEGAAERTHALATQVLPAMEEARRMTEEGYRAGRLDLLRLLDAQRAVLDSRLALAEAEAGYGRALADLERAAGRDLSGQDAHAR